MVVMMIIIIEITKISILHDNSTTDTATNYDEKSKQLNNSIKV